MPTPPSPPPRGGSFEPPPLPSANDLAGGALRSTLFRQALVTSGLVDALLLNRIDSAVVAKLPKNEQQQDEYYAALLIESGRVNRWQIEQLNKGRTKFTLGAYRILDSIGSGGMGHVFKGEHELLGRVEAIKVLPHNRSTPEAIASFRHEIRAQAQLDHPNLVRVSYADRDGETYFLVTEYVPGIDLRRLIRRRMGPLPEGVAACLIEQAAVAIDYAHRRGLVHRDVKPGNLLLTPEGDVKVIDLGLAWFLDEDATGVTPQGKGKIVGTSDYLAPEVIRHPGRIVPVSDIYSLGCTLYYALTGKVPFPGGSHLEKMRRHVSDEPTNPLTLNDKLSPTAINLLGRMMAKNPRERIESAAQVADALRWLHGEHDQLAAADLVAQALLRPTERKRLLTNDPSGNLPDTIGLPTDVSSRVAEQLHEREKQEAEDPVYDDGDTPASEPPGPSGSLWRRFTGG